jgi:hypothetical protein
LVCKGTVSLLVNHAIDSQGEEYTLVRLQVLRVYFSTAINRSCGVGKEFALETNKKTRTKREGVCNVIPGQQINVMHLQVHLVL